MKKMISWNVNGLRAVVSKGFGEIFTGLDADIFCLQETKLQAGQLDLRFDGYFDYWNYAERKGYSGTAVFTKEKPLSVRLGMNEPFYDDEGRLITLEYENFYLVNCYTPNSQEGLRRLEYRMSWEEKFLAYLKKLEQSKPVVFCGDLNVAHREIDLKNPKANIHNAGFTPEERGRFQALLDGGFIDTFRRFYPDAGQMYSWWSYRFHARDTNAGWRIDYFLVSESLKERLVSAGIHSELYGSDHCPVELVIDL